MNIIKHSVLQKPFRVDTPKKMLLNATMTEPAKRLLVLTLGSWFLALSLLDRFTIILSGYLSSISSSVKHYVKTSVYILSFLTISSNAALSQISKPVFKADLVRSEFIFQNPDFKECHASTITELSNNRFMAAWFGGSNEGAADVGIWTSIYKDNHWSNPVETVSSYISNSDRLPCWNPVLFKSRNGRLYLFYKQGKSPREWWGAVKTSDDDGSTWSEPQKLPDGFLGPIKNKPVQLAGGEILCPSSTESLDQKLWKVHIEITDESLTNWRKISIDTSGEFGVIQPCILMHPNGKLRILCRSRQNFIVQSWSEDGGLHWSNLTKTEVPNPNSGIDAVTLSNGLHVLVYNPLVQGQEWFNGRNVLRVAVSKDGEHWQDVYTLENEREGEYSYPAVIESTSGQVHITYTANRKNIKHTILAITSIK